MAYLIGISGGSGSGKTFFLNQLVQQFPQHRITVLSQDHYYKPREQQPVDVLGHKNFDTPESLFLDRFYSDVLQLSQGQSLLLKEYTYNNPLVEAKQLIIPPAPIVVLEGLFVFYQKEIFDLLNLKIFIDAAEEVKLQRRIERDRVERGYDKEDVTYRYAHHVSPMFVQYLEPYKVLADVVIDNNVTIEAGLAAVMEKLKGI